MEVRQAETEELDQLTEIWYNGWLDAHAAILPVELAENRTRESLRERLGKLLGDTRVVGEVGKPLGFSITEDDELNQLYVAAEARGKGAAQALIKEFEERLAANGIETVWLACAIGNNRAARFYEKSGWHLSRIVVHELQLKDGPLNLDVWRYEKVVRPESE